MSESTPGVSNFIVVIHGRGTLYTCLAKGTLEDIANLCEEQCHMGFEVHIYSLKASTAGQPSTIVKGLTPLQQEWQLWEAEDEFRDLTNSIIMHTEEHTHTGSIKYLQQCIEQLQTAKGVLLGEREAEETLLPPQANTQQAGS